MSSLSQEARRSLFFFRDDIIEMYKSGASTRQICRKFDVGDRRIKRVLERWGVLNPVSGGASKATKKKPSSKNLSDSETDLQKHKDIACALYEAGVSTTYIAEKFNVKVRMVRHRLSQWGLKMRSRSESTKIGHAGWSRISRPTTLGGKSIRDLREAYLGGKHLSDLSRQCGVSRQCLTNFLRKWRIPIRSRSENRIFADHQKAMDEFSKGPDQLAGFKLAELRAIYYDGMSANRMAEEVGVSTNTLLRFFSRHGVRTRPLSDALKVSHAQRILKRRNSEAKFLRGEAGQLESQGL